MSREAPFLPSGSGGTSNEGAKRPFLVVAGVSEFKRPFAFGAEATRRKRRAAGELLLVAPLAALLAPSEVLGLGGIEGLPPGTPFP